MSKPAKKEQQPNPDDVLRRMLSTPPDPHTKPAKKKKVKPKK
jgi:hypothetical protein